MLHIINQVVNVVHTQVAGGVTKLWPGPITALRPEAMQRESIPAATEHNSFNPLHYPCDLLAHRIMITNSNTNSKAVRLSYTDC